MRYVVTETGVDRYKHDTEAELANKANKLRGIKSCLLDEDFKQIKESTEEQRKKFASGGMGDD